MCKRPSILSLATATEQTLSQVLNLCQQGSKIFWLRGLDLHQRSTGYEPVELLLLHLAIGCWLLATSVLDMPIRQHLPPASAFTNTAGDYSK